ncbi:lysine N(6)-hydroxylase/L-ornithine N(5)-oxygenase family protein [Paenibacillus methanolicus]|uniref:L-lysine N6-monooxygenase MbtG n=1 Tax=Paenibacillus methanolicus TaxID=582686 RepID=A0A5S5BUB3_9BACL|nr:lysine N(6)-hydroxylase/L-ornithine N(5)-oxygenase family protein [Paenibacillus methanolicus]TYP70617.1 lysine N6-hydroxylase [Paenibacillus methanolicus]
MNGRTQIYDIVGIGIGPFNLGLAALLDPLPDVKALFLDRKPAFSWHPGMLLDGTTLQVPFLADLVTMADPTNPYSFLNYLKEQGRLYAFYFFERFHIPRKEYDAYCRWAAERIASCRFGVEVTQVSGVSEAEALGRMSDHGDADVSAASRASIPALAIAGGGIDQGGADADPAAFGHRVEPISPGELYRIEAVGSDGQLCVYYARNLALGVGSVPHVGETFKQHLAEGNVFHSAQFGERLEQCKHARSITVVGSGQSAAEVFLHLLNGQAEGGYRLDWLTRSPGFFPMEYSKLGLEHFSPDYTSYFYNLPPERKDEVRSKQHLLYKGISAGTIADIYDRLYELTVDGGSPDVRLLAQVDVQAIESLADGEKGYRLTCRHAEQDRAFEHETELVILATGYAHPVPSFLGPLRERVRWDAQGRYEVEPDYRLRLNGEGGGRIYVQNGELHSHGVGAPDLGLGAHRSSVIINSLAGRDVYPVRERNVFQQFGIGSGRGEG